ncbi:MAG: hypothetical protein ABIH03_15240, partial [Pseudomonadota bacterium]
REIAAIGWMLGALRDRARQQLLGMLGLPDFQSQNSGAVKQVRIARRHVEQLKKNFGGPTTVSDLECAERLSDQLRVI